MDPNNPNTNIDDSFWADVAAAPPPPEQEFEDLPVGLQYIGRTATNADNNWKPEAVRFETKQGERKGTFFYKFQVGLCVVGGENKVHEPKARLEGKWIRFSAYVLPGDREDQGKPEDTRISGRLTGFLNAVFAPGVGADMEDKEARRAARWSTTFKKLQSHAVNYPDLKPSAYVPHFPGQPQFARGMYIAALAAAVMQDQGGLVIFKTASEKPKEGDSTKRVRADVEEYTTELVQKRKVALFAGASTPAATTTF